jgi:hypothetical protein
MMTPLTRLYWPLPPLWMAAGLRRPRSKCSSLNSCKEKLQRILAYMLIKVFELIGDRDLDDAACRASLFFFPRICRPPKDRRNFAYILL